MKVRSTLLATLLMILMFTAACKKPCDCEDFIGGDQCPEGTTPITVITPEGETITECVPAGF